VNDEEEDAMAKLVLSMFISLDGYIEGPGGQFMPPAWSGDLERHWSGFALASAGRLLCGRKNFEFNRGFWQPAETDPDSPAAQVGHADPMNALPKTVVSTTLSGDPGWNGTVANGDLAAVVAKLKAETQGDIQCFGGAGIADSLIRRDLIDEYRLMVTPTLFGDGKRLFQDGRPAFELTLIETLPLDTGAVILRYRRDHQV
jgi:dihydrofolate reductase